MTIMTSFYLPQKSFVGEFSKRTKLTGNVTFTHTVGKMLTSTEFYDTLLDGNIHVINVPTICRYIL